MSYSPIVGSCLLVTSLASGALLSLFFSLHPPRQTTVIALSLLFLFAHSGSLIVFIFHPSIRPPPQGPGKSIFSYFFAWIGIQASGFISIDSLWARSWPDNLKNWAVAWMLLSLATVALWTYALITIIVGRRCRGLREMQNPEAGRISTMTEDSQSPSVSHDDAVHFEHIEFSQPPSAYLVIRLREKDEATP